MAYLSVCKCNATVCASCISTPHPAPDIQAEAAEARALALEMQQEETLQKLDALQTVKQALEAQTQVHTALSI